MAAYEDSGVIYPLIYNCHKITTGVSGDDHIPLPEEEMISSTASPCSTTNLIVVRCDIFKHITALISICRIAWI